MAFVGITLAEYLPTPALCIPLIFKEGNCKASFKAPVLSVALMPNSFLSWSSTLGIFARACFSAVDKAITSS